MGNRGTTKLLAWLLAPLALLGVLISLFLLTSFFVPYTAHRGVWEGEEFPSTDWLDLFLIPGLLINLLIGLALWWFLISFAYFPDDCSVRPAILWKWFLGFNIAASFFWILFSIHVHHNSNSSGYLFCLLPLLVTFLSPAWLGDYFLNQTLSHRQTCDWLGCCLEPMTRPRASARPAPGGRGLPWRHFGSTSTPQSRR
jgi:hypothetical protein